MPWRPASSLVLTVLALFITVSQAGAQPAKPENPAGPLTLLLLIPMALVSFTALEVVLWVLAAAPLAVVSQTIARRRGLCFLAGAVTALLVLALLTVLGNHKGAGGLLAALILGLTALGALVGLTAVTALLGEGALDLAGKTGSRALAVLLGSLLFGLVILFPLIGQVLGLYLLLVGLGGAVLALARAGRTD